MEPLLARVTRSPSIRLTRRSTRRRRSSTSRTRAGSNIFSYILVSVADPGWGKIISIRIRDEQPGSYFRELRNQFFGFKCFESDPESGMEKIWIRNTDTGVNSHYKCSTVWRTSVLSHRCSVVKLKGLQRGCPAKNRKLFLSRCSPFV